MHRELLRYHSGVLRGVLGGDGEDDDEELEEEGEEERKIEEEEEGTKLRLQIKPRIWEWRWLEMGMLEEVWEREDREGAVFGVDVRVKLPPPPMTTDTTMKRKKIMRRKKSGVALLKMRDVDGGLCGVRTWVAFEAWLYLGGSGLREFYLLPFFFAPS